MQQTLQRLLTEKLPLEEQVDLLAKLTLEPVTGQLLANLANIIYQYALPMGPLPSSTVDIVGTGGDNANTFNISTSASFVIAGAGIPVAKHGNRSVSSRSGSFDCLEKLGVVIPTTPEQALQQFNANGLCFLFAPFFHPILKNLAPARQILAKQGQKTILNLLGPLLNPARVKYQAVGVYRQDLVLPMAEALQLQGVERAFVFCSDGMDELSLTGSSFLASVDANTIETQTIGADYWGLAPCTREDLQGGDAEANASITLDILRGTCKDAKRDTVLLNAAAAIQLVKNTTFAESLQLARESLDSGAAFKKMVSGMEL